jgi:hypothetical protein
MFFVRNELKDLLKIKELAVFWLKNELYFGPQKHKTNPKIRPNTGLRTPPYVAPVPHSQGWNRALLTRGVGGQDVLNSSTLDSLTLDLSTLRSVKKAEG